MKTEGAGKDIKMDNGNVSGGFTRIENGREVDYTPITMWGYFGYELLFSVPFLGLVFLVYFAASAKNQNVKNFARSYFCVLIVFAVILIFLGAAFGTASGVDYLFNR